MQGTGDEPADIVEPKRRQHDLAHPRVRFLDRLQRSQKRVSGTDLVVPIGADQQQVPHLRVRDQVLDEVERGGIQPLQIIEEQRERMLPPWRTRQGSAGTPTEIGSALLAAAGRERPAVSR